VQLGLLLLYVEDFPTMLAFYRDVLGFRVTDEDPGPGHRPGIDWVQLAGDGGTIELFDHAVFGRARDFPLPRRNAAVITFRVEDVDARVGSLRAAGVDVERIHRAEWGAAAHFFDPEGNELQVFETA
jgi:catechol 2,3-dioxygenase-like lactoylglutathione lyase family enzyme